jgi:type IV secretion system protein TrbL
MAAVSLREPVGAGIGTVPEGGIGREAIGAAGGRAAGGTGGAAGRGTAAAGGAAGRGAVAAGGMGRGATGAAVAAGRAAVPGTGNTFAHFGHRISAPGFTGAAVFSTVAQNGHVY